MSAHLYFCRKKHLTLKEQQLFWQLSTTVTFLKQLKNYANFQVQDKKWLCLLSILAGKNQLALVNVIKYFRPILQLYKLSLLICMQVWTLMFIEQRIVQGGHADQPKLQKILRKIQKIGYLVRCGMKSTFCWQDLGSSIALLSNLSAARA